MFRSYLNRRTLVASAFELLVVGCGGMESGPTGSGDSLDDGTMTTGKGDSAKGGLNGTNATAAQPGPVHVAAIDSLDATYLADGTLQVNVTYTRGCNDALVGIVHH